MGLFVKKYYQGADIALNDIGAVSWLADINLLDLRGLGTNDIRDKSLTTEGLSSTYVEKLSEERGVKLTILHKRLMLWLIPETWIEVGSWKVQDYLVLGEGTVTFYATN
jgi:hypothetical protein